MREKLSTLPITELKELAKSQGLSVAGKKKEEIVDILCELNESTQKRTHQIETQVARQSQNASYHIKNHSSAISAYTPGGGYQPKEPTHRVTGLHPEHPEWLTDDTRAQRGDDVYGILEIVPDTGFGFLRNENYLPSPNDVYVSPIGIKRYGLKTGDVIDGYSKVKVDKEKFAALLGINTVNGFSPEEIQKRVPFDKLTPIYPKEKLKLLENNENDKMVVRAIDFFAPVGKGQRGLLVCRPKSGRYSMLKDLAAAILKNNDLHLMLLLIDARPEDVSDMKSELAGAHVEIIYSTFDEEPDRHKRVTEMVVERAKRLAEQKQDVVILLDDLTRLTRAYNLIEPTSGRTFAGGLDAAAFHMPKKIFGSARNLEEGGSITMLATCLVETGSKMDDAIYEEFEGTGNMEFVINKRIIDGPYFPNIDLLRTGTRRSELLNTPKEKACVDMIKRLAEKDEEIYDKVSDTFEQTKNNEEFIQKFEALIKKD